ncbi:hypothetical protein ACRAWF_10530 [Streptomyces sp. L7]
MGAGVGGRALPRLRLARRDLPDRPRLPQSPGIPAIPNLPAPSGATCAAVPARRRSRAPP